MRSTATLASPWVGRYPERRDDVQRSRDRQWWRALFTPFWSHRLALHRANRFVDRVVEQLPAFGAASDEHLGRLARDLRRALSNDGLGDGLCAYALALVAETARRRLGMLPHRCQLLGAWAMLNGRLAEMDTGEGKTLTIAMAAATAGLAHRRTHVITVNDYLVERDARELAPFYQALGLTVAGVTAELRDPAARAAAWRNDVVYCCNKGLAFDYLRDRVAMGARRGALHREIDVLRGAPPALLPGLEFGIVDEADSVLIDECRTPLILSRECPPIYPQEVFAAALRLAGELAPGRHYRAHAHQHRIELRPAGQAALQEEVRGLGEFWAPARRREELVRQALSALHLFRRDEHYLVRDGRVEIIDPNTGRVMPDRSWELGLQQMIETREGCAITGAKETLARITYQRFFGRYRWLAAATGTGGEVAGELWRVYGLRVMRVPRHRASQLLRQPTTIHATAANWLDDLVVRIRHLVQQQRPVLVATRTVAASEALSAALSAARLPHQVLNARHDAAEAAIVAKAGLAGRITVATNMAGRGTDIRLGGGVDLLGGLHVIATELNESTRLDRQLAGRAGRQGDSGSYERVLSLQDGLLGRHLPAWLLRPLTLLLDGRPRLGQWCASLASRALQWRLETTAARHRRAALDEDRRIGDALSFAGSTE